MGGGGGGKTVEYVERPTAQQAPARTAADEQYLADQRNQMAEMQKSYQANLDRLNEQYAASRSQSDSVLQQLQASAEQQRVSSDRNRQDMLQANEASNRQLSLLSASRDQAVGQASEARSMQTNQTGSMFDRLNRRRQARRTIY